LVTDKLRRLAGDFCFIGPAAQIPRRRRGTWRTFEFEHRAARQQYCCRSVRFGWICGPP